MYGPVGKAECVAVADGELFSVSGGGAYGNRVIIKHQIMGKNGVQSPVFYTMYCHMANINILPKNIKQGQVLGMMGSTGNVTGPHCHFEFSLSPGMWKTSKDPMYWVFEEHILKDNNVQI